MIALVDTHVHINFPEFATELSEIQERWREKGVKYLVHSCVHPQEFPQIQAIADQFAEVRFAVGLHPLDDHLNTQGWLPTVGEQIYQLAASDHRVVAIGEMGLDFYKAENKAAQKSAFLAQLEISSSLNLPVIIHCRDAAEETRDLLIRWNACHPDRPVRGVMHCWSGTPEETQWFLDLGMYISFSGIVTFKNARSVQDSAKVVPPDRLLIETDCPYLAPVPRRGKRNEPSYVAYVAAKLAELRGEPLAVLAQQTTDNACKLFHLS